MVRFLSQRKTIFILVITDVQDINNKFNDLKAGIQSTSFPGSLFVVFSTRMPNNQQPIIIIIVILIIIVVVVV